MQPARLLPPWRNVGLIRLYASSGGKTALGIAIALVGGLAVYGLLKTLLRLSQEEKCQGADLSIQRSAAKGHHG